MRKRERELHASRKCGCALSVSHSFIQSVSMRDYYIYILDIPNEDGTIFTTLYTLRKLRIRPISLSVILN